MTAEKWRRIAERKRQRKEEKEHFFDDKVWRNCELCKRRYCVNNYADEKIRLVKWRGFAICGYCRYYLIPVIRKLEKRKILKFRKAKS